MANKSDGFSFEEFLDPLTATSSKKTKGQYNEGGLTDDGMNVDPVSGNEVPSGSLAEEVRDDIPAQLSEGEYVVPADVVRYYGVKYFEDLRSDAKQGLNQMENDGRIGGEPVDGMSNDLSAEEMAELESIMGYNQGGGVTTDVPTGSQVSLDFSNFGAGFSFMGDQPGQNLPQIYPTSNLTLYGPNGEVVNLILPTDQARYNELMAQGYSTQPVSQVQAPVVQTTQQDDNGIGQVSTAAGGTAGGPDDSRYGSEELTSMIKDPLKYGRESLEGKFDAKTAGIAGGLLLGPLGGIGGAAIGTKNTLDNIADAKAAALMAENLGYDASALNKSVSDKISDLNVVERTFIKEDDVNERAKQKYEELMEKATDPSFGGGIGRDAFAEGESGDEAFNKQMEKTAPTGMTYDRDTGSYKAVEGAKAPATTPRPALRPDNLTSGGDSGSDEKDDTNVGNYTGDRDGDGVPNWRDYNDGVGANDKNKDGGGSSEGSGKIVCTAMNTSYGFGSYRQAIWLRYSQDSLTEYHEKGYHKIFLPLVDKAYNRGDKNSKLLRKVLENIARHRTADLRAEMQGKKRDTVGRIYRAVLEPVCYIVGRLSK